MSLFESWQQQQRTLKNEERKHQAATAALLHGYRSDAANGFIERDLVSAKRKKEDRKKRKEATQALHAFHDHRNNNKEEDEQDSSSSSNSNTTTTTTTDDEGILHGNNEHSDDTQFLISSENRKASTSVRALIPDGFIEEKKKEVELQFSSSSPPIDRRQLQKEWKQQQKQDEKVKDYEAIYKEKIDDDIERYNEENMANISYHLERHTSTSTTTTTATSETQIHSNHTPKIPPSRRISDHSLDSTEIQHPPSRPPQKHPPTQHPPQQQNEVTQVTTTALPIKLSAAAAVSDEKEDKEDLSKNTKMGEAGPQLKPERYPTSQQKLEDGDRLAEMVTQSLTIAPTPLVGDENEANELEIKTDETDGETSEVGTVSTGDEESEDENELNTSFIGDVQERTESPQHDSSTTAPATTIAIKSITINTGMDSEDSNSNIDDSVSLKQNVNFAFGLLHPTTEPPPGKDQCAIAASKIVPTIIHKQTGKEKCLIFRPTIHSVKKDDKVLPRKKGSKNNDKVRYVVRGTVPIFIPSKEDVDSISNQTTREEIIAAGQWKRVREGAPVHWSKVLNEEEDSLS